MTTDRHADPVPPQPALPSEVRRSQLPPIPPPEWQFHTWFPNLDSGGTLVPGQLSRGAQIRRRVTYGDWEPVHPDHWAPEPPSEPASKVDAAPPAPAPVDEALTQRVAEAIRTWHADWNKATFEECARDVLAELAPELARAEKRRAQIARAAGLPEDTNWLGTTVAIVKHRQDARRLGELVDRLGPTEQQQRHRAEEATAALAEILAAVRTLRDADTGQPIHVPGRITPEQLTRWQRIAHPGDERGGTT